MIAAHVCANAAVHASRCLPSSQLTGNRLPGNHREGGNYLFKRRNSLLLASACVGACRNGAQKLLGVLITVGEAVAYVVSGMYGDVRELGAGNAILIIVQACAACGNTLAARWRLPCLAHGVDLRCQISLGARWTSLQWPQALLSLHLAGVV